MFPIKSPRPVPKEIGYYLNYRNRGYLSSRLQFERLKGAMANNELDEVKKIQAASQIKVYVGGGPIEHSTDDLTLTAATTIVAKKVVSTSSSSSSLA